MEFKCIGTGYGFKKDRTGKIYGFIITNGEQAFVMNREKIDGSWVEIFLDGIQITLE